MKRLTKRLDCGRVAIFSAEDGEEYIPQAVLFRDAVDRLAAYEDIGMTPKEVKLIANVLREVGETYNCWFNYVAQCVIEHSKLQKFAQADRAGQLVVLPAGVTRESLSGELASLADIAFEDGEETYTTGYRNGHKNGVIETLRRVLGIPDGTCQDAKAALELRKGACGDD